MRKLLAWMMALVIVLGGVPAVELRADTNTPPGQPTGLRVELMENAYSISTMDPSFSWIVQDVDYDEVQAAYRLVFARTLADVDSEDYLLDTGWVDSAQSTAVKAAGLPEVLEPNSLYYWQVQTKDRQDAASPLSDPAAFTTGVEWAATEGIWLEPRIVDLTDAQGDSSQTEQTAQDAGEEEISADTDEESPEDIAYMHVGYLGDVDDIQVELGESAEDGEVPEDGTEKGLHSEDELPSEVTEENGQSEESPADLIVQEQGEGDAADDTQGVYHADRIETENVDPAPLSQWVNYSVEQDITITRSALGIVFHANGSNNYMWQFRVDTNSLNPHKNYTSSYNDPVYFSESGVTIRQNEAFHLRIDIEDNVITTYINDTQVDQRPGENYGFGTIGYRTGGSEAGRADNVVVTNLDTNEIIYAEDFSSGVSVYGNCTVVDGALNIPASTACYIAVENDKQVYEELVNYVFLRHAFDLEDISHIEKAIVSATGYNTESVKQHVFDLYLNGNSVGVGPGRNQINTVDGVRQHYNSYDVTDLLQDGENVIGAIGYNKDAARGFLLQMTVYYTDGTSKVLLNSARDAEQWKGKDGTLAFGQTDQQFSKDNWYYQHAENMNANQYPFGWDDAGFEEDAFWRAVQVNGAVNGNRVLVPYAAENSRRFLMPAMDVTYRESTGSYVVTLEKAIVGGLQIDIDSPSVKTITVHYGEAMNSDGSVKQNGTGHPNYIEYWTLRQGEQSLKTVSMKNYRYVEIFGSPVEITRDMVKGYAIRQEFDDDAAYFDSSNDFLNELYEFTKYTVKATNQDLWTDSMARERGAYEGDAIINMISNNAFSANYALGRFSHEYLVNYETWPQEYKLFSVEVAWLDYLYTGDKTSLEEYYAKLKNKFPGTFNASTGLVQIQSNVLVDWPSNERDGYVFQDYMTSYNAVYAAACGYMANIAEALGYESDRVFYQDRADVIKQSMIEKLYNPDRGAFDDSMSASSSLSGHYAQHATAFALAYGIFDSQEMADQMTGYLDGHGGFRTSIYATHFVLNGLYRGNAGDVAMRFMANEDAANKRTWAHVLYNLNATISPEAWDPSHKGNMTYSHPWGSSPAGGITQGMFGIKPLEPGFELFQIKFQPGGITSAELMVPTVRGSVEASYSLGDGDNNMTASVTIPANTRAQVSLPVDSIGLGKLLVNGRSMLAQRDGRYLTVTLGSGTYTISISDEVVPYLGVTATVANNGVLPINGKGTVSVAAVNETGEAVDLAGAAITYQSSNESVAVVDNNGVITTYAEGSSVITVTVQNGDLRGIATVRVRVSYDAIPEADKIETMEIRLSTLKTGEAATPQLIGHLKDGGEIEIEGAAYQSLTPEVARVNGDGTITLLQDGDFTLTATPPDMFDRLASNFDFSLFRITPFYTNDFESGENPFPGTEIRDGRLYVGRGKNAIYQGGTDWTDYIFTMTMNVVEGSGNPATSPGGPAGTVHVRAASTSQLYMWQFFSNSNHLKKHINVSETGAVISPIDAMNPAGQDNRIAVAVEGDRIMSYVNGKLVDTAYYTNYSQGSIGVRTGSMEEFYLDDIVVGTRELVIEQELTASEDGGTANPEDIKAVEIRLEGELSSIGDSATATLVGIRWNKEEVVFADAAFTSSDNSVATVDENGVVTLVGAGDFTLKAATSQRFDELDPDFDFQRFAITPLYANDFESGENPFPGTEIRDGRLYVGRSKNAIYQGGTDWTDYIFTMTMNVVEGSGNPATSPGGPAGTVHVRAASTSQLYMWQFFPNSNHLKKHINVSETGAVISPIDAMNPAGQDNRIAVAVEGDRIMSYVNGKLVDTAYYTNYGQGSIGVRTGSMEEFYLDDIVVGTRQLVTEMDLSVSAGDIPVESIMLDNAALTTLGKGDTLQLSAIITPSNASDPTITWTSSTPTIATIDEKGLVTGIKSGTVRITATTSNGKTAVAVVRVTA